MTQQDPITPPDPLPRLILKYTKIVVKKMAASSYRVNYGWQLLFPVEDQVLNRRKNDFVAAEGTIKRVWFFSCAFKSLTIMRTKMFDKGSEKIKYDIRVTISVRFSGDRLNCLERL